MIYPAYRICFLDTETRSRTPIERGNDLYSRDAECLIVTYAIGDRPVRLWEPWRDKQIPADLQQAIDDPFCVFVAHNAVFDRLILLRCLRIRLRTAAADNVYGDVYRWRCTRAQAYAHGLPGSLELLGLVCGLPLDQQKLVEDGKLIHTFCVPQAGRFIEPWEKPEEWAKFCAYAVRDTEALREIYRRLPIHNYDGRNLEAWWLDQLINERGFGFDVPLAVAASEFLADAKIVSADTMASLTENEVHAATQRARLLKYLREKLNIPIESMKAAEVREWLEHDDLDPVARLILEQRLEAGKSSGSKYNRGLAMVGPRNRQRNTIQFNGAGRTGRDSGRGFQPQNMARPALTVRRENGRIELTPVKASYIDTVVIPGIYSKLALRNDLVYGGPHEAAALTLRHVIVAAPSNELVVGDWKNIESVITAWISGQLDELEAFREAFANPKDKSLDVYRKQFSAFFGTPVLEVNDTERQAGKVSKLAFGFGGGVGALVTMAAGYQMDLEPLADLILPRATEQQRKKAYKAWRKAFLNAEDYELEPRVYQACDVLKQVYRATNDKINQLRYDLGRAVADAIELPNASYDVGKCIVNFNGDYLRIQLPSGRRLLYAGARMEKEILYDPTGEDEPREVSYLTFLTARGKSWVRIRAWPGLVLENIVQAIAADIKREKSIALHWDTWNTAEVRQYLQLLPPEEQTALVLMVHDELVLDVPVGSYSQERLAAVMTAPISWAPGLPLAVDTWQNKRYGKR